MKTLAMSSKYKAKRSAQAAQEKTTLEALLQSFAKAQEGAMAPKRKK